ncbi:hypothetical protein [Actinocrispum wychmicini]|uniref:Uncharacterized protein n=1 Tax=Actinocrispum wychmicini TaxID=1213861 RepID=A0A4R2JXJ3_9PSEU|nr:hypothetical protein [Actinocrispum wychmicini]TCO64594.1 hypothetical protein EV192_101371 [Actinocrispum wychmicini]
MTITDRPQPTHTGPIALTRGFLTGCVSGVTLASLVAAPIIESVPLVIVGVGLPVVYSVLLFIGGIPRRAREAAAPRTTALAKIESLRALGSDSGDMPVRFVVTVAPDGPPFRAEITLNVNLVDLPTYKPGNILVVDYPTDRPWHARILTEPTPEWERRAANAVLESAPESALVKEPPKGGAFGTVVFIGVLIGAVAVLVLFRADLFGTTTAVAEPSAADPAPTTVTSTSSTTITSANGTVTLGSNQSFRDRGTLKDAVAALTRDRDGAQVISVIIQDRVMSVVFAPSGSPAPGFDLRELPTDRIRPLVDEATVALGVTSPSWEVIMENMTGSLTIRVVVTGRNGSASLEANRSGNVVRRNPLR